MAEWQPIEAAPKDGTVITTKRVYAGMTMGPYQTVWATMAHDAPMRGWSPGGLDGPMPPDHEFADRPTWLTSDRRYCVPGPTHWLPPEAIERGR